MPSVLATIPSMSSALNGQAVLAGQSAVGAHGISTLACSLGALSDSGTGTAKTSLGLFVGAAPTNGRLQAMVSGTVFEFGAMAVAGFGQASADASLRFSLQEFSPEGYFIQDLIAPPVFLYNDEETFFGINIHRNELHTVNFASTFQVVGGHIYMLWVDSVQDVSAQGLSAQAVSNFSYSLGAVTFSFVP